MSAALATVLRLADAGATVQAMCSQSGLKTGRVYAILRQHRPERPRQARRRTSDVPDKVRALHATGAKPSRIAFVLDVTPAYVYAILKRTA